MKAISVNAKSNKATNNLTVFVPSAIGPSVCLLFSYEQSIESSQSCYELARDYAPCTNALMCALDTIVSHSKCLWGESFSPSPSLPRLSLPFPPILFLSISPSLPPLSATSPFFPCSRFRSALLIAAECDPPSLSLSLVHFRWIINQLPLCEPSRAEPRTNRRRRDGKVIEPEIAGANQPTLAGEEERTPRRQGRREDRKRRTSVVINRWRVARDNVRWFRFVGAVPSFVLPPLTIGDSWLTLFSFNGN